MTIADGIARALALSGSALAAYCAYRAGGGADAAVPPPRPASVAPPAASAPAATPTRAQGAAAYEVFLRLNEALGDATSIDVPSLGAAYAHLRASNYYRFMPGPWTHPTGAGARLPIAATMVTTMEIPPTVALGNGSVWTPDGKVWNMNEGSFDMRESIFAPSPSTIAWKLTIPPDARLEYAAGILQNFESATIFSVSIVDAKGEEHELSTSRVQAGDAKKWLDVTVDLGPFAGQSVLLRLQTRADKPKEREKRWAAPPPPAPGDAGRSQWVQPVPRVALALWGNPKIMRRAPTRVPYNVLWIVVDALRPDVSASFHDDEEDKKSRAARYPPLDALLPKVPGLTPSIDALAARGVRFTHAYSGATWTRPGTLAMLAGSLSSTLGIDTKAWLVPAAQIASYYASDPPLVSLLLRRSGVVTRGVIDNFYMTGYATVALDFGFEGLLDHRYRVDDTDAITRSSIEWLRAHSDERFFLFCNFNSPHEPFEPPPAFLARVPPPPRGPDDGQVRRYMGEGAKDDAAIGALIKTLDDLELRKSTIIVVTSDHGETLSSAHQGQAYVDEGGPLRFHHQNGIFEETTRIPILLSLPGVLDGNKAVTARVRNIDLAPTILELEGLPRSDKMSGLSLMPLVRGEAKDDRVVVSEGRGTRAILVGKHRYIQRDGSAAFVSPWGKIPEELFDLEVDPGERHSIHQERPDIVSELKAQLAASLAGAPAAATRAERTPEKERSTLHFRFVGAGDAHAIAGTIGALDPRATISFDATGARSDSFTRDGATLRFSFVTSADSPIALDLRIDPERAAVEWTLTLDGAPWPDDHVFVGPYGLAATHAKLGLSSDEAEDEVYASELPAIDPVRDLGVFVTKDRRGDASARVPQVSAEGAEETRKLLEQWGYARKAPKR